MNEKIILTFFVTLNENSRAVAIDTHGPGPHFPAQKATMVFLSTGGTSWVITSKLGLLHFRQHSKTRKQVFL